MVNSFFDFGGVDFYITTIIAIFNAYLVMKVLRKGLTALQLEEYKNSRYFEYLIKSFNSYLGSIFYIFALSILFGICITLMFRLLGLGVAFSFIAIVCYIYLVLDFIEKDKRQVKKSKLVFTKRLKRLYFFAFLVNFALTFAIIRFSCIYVDFLGYGAIAVSVLASFMVVPLCNVLIFPLEYVIYKHYIRLAKRKLGQYPNLIKIAVTGSVGKTSTKFILQKLLSENYKVCVSPKSYNTPMGLTKTILNNLQPYHDVLLVEMGANRKNDISKLCDIIQPNIGIVTAVGNSHLKTFKNMQNLIQTKQQLVQSVQGTNGGFMVFNAENATSLKFYHECTCDKAVVSCSRFGADVFALNVAYSEKGATFTLYTKSGKVDCKTRLVGRHNLENILLAAAVALKLGVELDSLPKLISELEPIEHRLQLKAEGEYFILDDAFNSNAVGFENALEVLNYFKGKKIVVTPGIVELEKDAYKTNYEIARKIATVADVCIIVNAENKKALCAGINNKIKTYTAQTFNDALKILNKELETDACVLFENDLPDNYI